MLGFTPFKKHANKFNYIPRYYDPEKEAREQRRAELRGERAEDAGGEYRPDNISAPSAMRAPHAVPRRRRRGATAFGRWPWAPVLVLLFIYILYPRLADVFLRARTSAPAQTEAAGAEETVRRNGLDQSGISDVEWQEQPITVVPNDYQE